MFLGEQPRWVVSLGNKLVTTELGADVNGWELLTFTENILFYIFFFPREPSHKNKKGSDKDISWLIACLDDDGRSR